MKRKGKTMNFIDRVDPELRPLLPLMEQALGGISAANLPERRAAASAQLAAMKAKVPANTAVIMRDVQAAGPEGAPDVKVRVYAGKEKAGRPGILWIHGGGMIVGSIGADDGNCSTFAEQLDAVVVSVEYRLAPENPHPAPVEDCYAALVWMAAHANELGLDLTRIAVAGASAGGGLAAATALLARDRGGPALAFQCLTYPMLDDRNETPSSHEFTGIASWSREHNALGWSALLCGKAGGADVSMYAAPARATSLAGLPPALIQVGELEVFRDEDMAYATRLMQAGVAAELHVYAGAIHAWDMVAGAAVTQRLRADRLAALRRALVRA